MGGGGTDTHSNTRVSLGAGVMLQVTDKVSLDLEFCHHQFMPQTYDTGGLPVNVALDADTP